MGFSKDLDAIFATTTMTSILNKEWLSCKIIVVGAKVASKSFENPRPHDHFPMSHRLACVLQPTTGLPSLRAPATTGCGSSGRICLSRTLVAPLSPSLFLVVNFPEYGPRQVLPRHHRAFRNRVTLQDSTSEGPFITTFSI